MLVGAGPLSVAAASPVPAAAGVEWLGDDHYDTLSVYDEEDDESEEADAEVGAEPASFVPPHLLHGGGLSTSGCSVSRDPTSLSSRFALRRLANWM